MFADSWLSTVLERFSQERNVQHALRVADRFAGSHRGGRVARRFARCHLHWSGLAYGLPLPRLRQEADSPAAPHVATVSHLMDLVVQSAYLLGRALPAERLRPTLVGVLMASVGTGSAAGASRLLASPAPDDALGAERALGLALKRRLTTFAAVNLGLALHCTLTAVDTRLVARVALRAVVDGCLSPERFASLHACAARERRAVVMALSCLQMMCGGGPAVTEAQARKLLASSGLDAGEVLDLANLLAHPPSTRQLAGLRLPRNLADLLVCQLVLTALVEKRVQPGERYCALELAQPLGIPLPRALRMARRAGQLHTAHQAALRTLMLPDNPPSVALLPGSALASRLTKVLLRNLDALVLEIRETGELAALLAKAAAGNALSDQEWQKVRAQLLDVCRAVPSLAVFALPGGAVLLPLLLRFLPFDLRPSAFRDMGSVEDSPTPAASTPGDLPVAVFSPFRHRTTE